MLFMYILQQKEQCNAMHTHTYTHTTCKKRDARKQGHTEGSDSHGKQRKGGERKEANQAHRQTHTHTESGKNGLANRLKKSIKHRKLSNAGGIVEAGTRENVKHRRVNAAVQILEPA